VGDGKSIGELAELLGARLEGGGTGVVDRVASIGEAGPRDLTFVTDARNLKLLGSSGAGAAILKDAEGAGKGAPEGMSLLLVKNPLLAAARAMGILNTRPAPAPGLHPGAFVHHGASVGEGASIGAHAVIDDGASVGPGTIVYPGAYIGIGARVGSGCTVYPGAVIMDGCTVGDRVIIHANAVVGSDGFGFAEDEGVFHKIPQTGTVRIEDDVEIGAGVTIDRATLGETVVGRGTKVDNLAQIAHNVKIGPHSIVVAQVGIAGSATIGSHVMIGGQAGINGHITIGDGVMVSAKAGVVQDLPPGGVVSGYPAIPHREWLRAQSLFGRLPEMKKKIAELEARIKGLEGKPEKKDG